jgi:CDP-Glycerol:Poly(glycerophosphate) glycerophosphotransferase
VRLVARLPVTGFQAALHLVVVAAFICLVITDHRHLGYALTLVGLLGVAVRGDGSGPAATTPALVILTAGVLADLPLSWATAYCGAVVLVLVTSQAALATIGRVPRIRAFNLVGFSQQRRPAAPAEAIGIVTVTLAAALAAAGYGSWPVWPISIAATAAFIGLVGIVGYGRVQLARMKPDDASLRAVLDRLAPAFIAYFAGERGEEHQLIDWLPYLEQIGTPFLVVVRDIRSARVLRQCTTAPVLHCPTVPTVDATIAPSVRAVFYVNNANLNSHIARFSKLTHIQLLHGDSDKPASFNPVSAIFDRIFVAGQAGIQRYADHGVVIAEAKFDVVGRPQVAGVEPARIEPGNVVLYAPTNPGRYADEDFCSLRNGEKIIRSLLDANAVVILRGHPELSRTSAAGAQLERLRRLLRDDRTRTGRPHVFGPEAQQMTMVEAMNASDALISDVSAVAVDYLASGKPYALTDMRGDATESVAISPITRAAYLIAADALGCEQTVARLLAGGSAADEKRSLRVAVRDYYLAPDGFVAAASRHLAAETSNGTVSSETVDATV